LEGLWWRTVEVVRWVKETERCLMVMRVDLGKGRLRSAGRDEGAMRMGVGMVAWESREREQTTWWLWKRKEMVGGREVRLACADEMEPVSFNTLARSDLAKVRPCRVSNPNHFLCLPTQHRITPAF
jgi:hypothetical protein